MHSRALDDVGSEGGPRGARHGDELVLAHPRLDAPSVHPRHEASAEVAAALEAVPSVEEEDLPLGARSSFAELVANLVGAPVADEMGVTVA